MESYVTVREAARIKNVTREAIYLAIRDGKLKAYDDGSGLRVFVMDLITYDRKKYCRENSEMNGEKIIDANKGEVSIEKAAQMIGVPQQKLYYACRSGKLKAIRKGSTLVIMVDELMQYEKQYLKKEFTQKKVV